MTLLDGKSAIVFGASGKLGGAVVAQLIANGAKTAIHYHRNVAAARKLAAALDPTGERVLTVQADATDEQSLAAAVQHVKDSFGSLDIVVSSIHPKFEAAAVFDSSITEWNDHLDALKSHYLISKAALPIMREQRFGRIIYVSAALAVRYEAGCSMYTTVKRGLNGFCRTLAIEEGKNNILVNIVAPGGVSDSASQTGEDWDNMTKKFMERCALGRFATSKEVANTVVYFASPLADGITGQTLYVSGGEIML